MNEGIKLERTVLLPREIEEGWGIICVNQNTFIVSNGTNKLYTLRYDSIANEIELVNTTVIQDDQGYYDEENLNISEMEEVDGLIYANIWYSNSIVVIEKDRGSIIR